MVHKKPHQKLIAFTENSPDFELVKQDMEDGWHIISLIKNGAYYVGIMEKPHKDASVDPQTFFIPPRKRVKISS